MVCVILIFTEGIWGRKDAAWTCELKNMSHPEETVQEAG